MKFIYTLTTTKNLNLTDTIFETYPDPTYLMKVSKLNRPMIKIQTTDKTTIGVVVLGKSARALKICLLLVHPAFQNKGLAKHLLNLTIDMMTDDFSEYDLIYTVCPHQFATNHYQSTLLQSGFTLTTIKANGDYVYTYAKSI